jgi:hypothetical protein
LHASGKPKRFEDFDKELAKVAKALNVSATDARSISKVLAEQSDRVVLELPEYEIRVKSTRRFEYVISGRRRKRR